MDSMTFLDEDESLVPDKSVTIIPAPLANTLSWGKGADQGPAALIQASKALESFDDELLSETFRVGIETLSQLDLADIANHPRAAKLLDDVQQLEGLDPYLIEKASLVAKNLKEKGSAKRKK